MDYLLFSYPSCPKCDTLKDHMKNQELEYSEYNLSRRESKQKIREYLQVIKRDEAGAIILPTLILLQDSEVTAVLNSSEELEDWLRSRD